MVSLAAARAPVRGTGMGDLVNALVFASRASAELEVSSPQKIAAQTATTELVEQIAWLAEKPKLSRADVRSTVDYIVDIAPLPALPERTTPPSRTQAKVARASAHVSAAR